MIGNRMSAKALVADNLLVEANECADRGDFARAADLAAGADVRLRSLRNNARDLARALERRNYVGGERFAKFAGMVHWDAEKARITCADYTNRARATAL